MSDAPLDQSGRCQFVGRRYVRADGAITWSADESDRGTVNAPAEIARLDGNGFSRLDQGNESALDPATLRPSRIMLTWKHDGVSRTAALN